MRISVWSSDLCSSDLSTAIAIYVRDLHLMFFNTAYAHLWELYEDFLQGHPHLGDVLEALRDRRRFPEYPNFPAYKREVLQKYATLIAQEEELVHLPDGSTLRMVVTPHPLDRKSTRLNSRNT